MMLKRYVGTDYLEADAAFVRAIEAGLTAARALVVANVASFLDCWTARRKLAAFARTSLSTVQRALNQAAELGLIGKARAKLGEHLPGLPEPQTCGYSHRWTIGRGMAAAAAQAAIAAARVAQITRRAFNAPSKPKAQAVVLKAKAPRPEQRAQRRYTAAELDAELAKMPAAEPPAEPREPQPAHERTEEREPETAELPPVADPPPD